MGAVIVSGLAVVTVVGLLADLIAGRLLEDALSARRRRRAITRVIGGNGSSPQAGPEVITSIVEALPLRTLRDRMRRLVEAGAERRRLARLEAQLPHALSLVASGLAAGMSLSQAFGRIHPDVPEPLATELRTVTEESESGLGLVEALRRWSERTPLAGLETLLVAIELQYRLGGDMVALLDRATSSLREADSLRARLRVQTAQARLSARIVGALPLILLVVLSLSSREYLSGFFTSPISLISLIIALTLEGIGAFFVARAAAVEI